MTLIVSKNGKNAVKLRRSSFEKESHLQKYISDNPEIIPVDEIEEGARFLVLDREFPLKRIGFVDIIGTDGSGNIYIIETKLFKNPDKRAVVAQILEYGAGISQITPDAFIELLDQRIHDREGISLEEKLDDFFGEHEVVIQGIKDSLVETSERFIVLMDLLSIELKNLVKFLNKSSYFSIYIVELEVYKMDEYEMLIPHIFGEEVEKNVVSKISSGLTQAKENYIDFYLGVIYETNQRLNIGLKSPRGNQYQQIPLGIGGVHFEWSFHGRPRNEFCVELHFEKKEKEWNIRTLNRMLEFRDEFEQAVGEKLIVDENFASNWTRIYFSTKGDIITEELADWAINKMVFFYNAAYPRLKEVLKYD